MGQWDGIFGTKSVLENVGWDRRTHSFDLF